DLLEGFHRRSGSRMWYWWQGAGALPGAAVRENGRQSIALLGAGAFGGGVLGGFLYQVLYSGMRAANHADFLWRMSQRHDALLFGQLFWYLSLVVSIATEAISAAVAVRVYRGHRPMVALLYAGFVLARAVGGRALDSIYYDQAANALHYAVRLPPFGI